MESLVKHQWLDALNQEPEGWKASLFVDGDEAEEGQDPWAEDTVRREQWIVAGDQYVFIERDEDTNEWGDPEIGEHPGAGTIVHSLEDLLPFVRDREGQEIHPVLKRMLDKEGS
jgi:hypothetical protein